MVKTLLVIIFAVFFTCLSAGWADNVWLYSKDADRAKSHLDLIENAQSSVKVSYFDITEDRIGGPLLASLRDAAKRGVKVQVTMDALASHITPATLEYLQKEGIEFKMYHPISLNPKKWPSFNQRLHDKIVIVDDKKLIIGTENISEAYYASLTPRTTAKFTGRHVLLEGQSAKEASTYFDKVWQSSHVSPPAKVAVKPQSLAESEKKIKWYKRLSDKFKQSYINGRMKSKVVGDEYNSAQFVYNSLPNSLVKKSITHDLSNLITSAKKNIVIQTPYLLPDSSIDAAIFKKLEEGIPVTIYTNSLRSTNQKIPGYVYSYEIEKFRKAGARILEAQSDITQHGKTVVIDQQKVFIGSYNLNRRSAKLDLESGIIVDSSSLAKDTTKAIATSTHWSSQTQSPKTKSCLGSILYHIVNTVLPNSL